MSLSPRRLRFILEPAARFLARHPRWFIAGVLAYLVIPVDALPEAVLGPAGYLDDLFVLLFPLLVREYLRKLDQPKPRPNDYVDTTAR